MPATRHTLHGIHYTVYTTRHTLHGIHYTVYTTRYTLHGIHYTVYTTRHTLHGIHYTVYTTRHTLHETENGNTRFYLSHIIYSSKWSSFTANTKYQRVVPRTKCSVCYSREQRPLISNFRLSPAEDESRNNDGQIQTTVWRRCGQVHNSWSLSVSADKALSQRPLQLEPTEHTPGPRGHRELVVFPQFPSGISWQTGIRLFARKPSIVVASLTSRLEGLLSFRLHNYLHATCL